MKNGKKPQIKRFLIKSKVFRYFKKYNTMVDLKIIIAVIAIIVVVGIVIGGVIEFNSEKEIQWRTSGPFAIEKYEYYLGEKIFLQVNKIPKDVSGEIIFFRPAPDGINKNPKEFEDIPKELISKKVKFLSISFDGKNKQNFNRFFEPGLNEWKGICDRNDVVGEWIVAFSGTQYKEMHFTVLNYSMPTDPRIFEPLVGIGTC